MATLIFCSGWTRSFVLPTNTHTAKIASTQKQINFNFATYNQFHITYLHITYVDTLEIEGRSFLSAIVIKWSDIKIKSIIGEGNFGRVYQGDIHLNEIQK